MPSKRAADPPTFMTSLRKETSSNVFSESASARARQGEPVGGSISDCLGAGLTDSSVGRVFLCRCVWSPALAPGRGGQRCGDASTLLQRPVFRTAGATRIVQTWQAWPELVAEAVVGQAGAIETELVGKSSKKLFRVRKCQKSRVIVGISGHKGADRGRVGLVAFGRVVEAGICHVRAK